jgi:Tfp pilus assembly protein PilZ
MSDRCTLLVVARAGDARDAYVAELERLDVEPIVLGDTERLLGVLQSRAFHGVLLDVATLILSERSDKLLINEISNLFPTARARWDAAGGAVRLLYHGLSQETTVDLSSFIENECRHPRPRRMRSERRMDAVIPALLSYAVPFDKAGARRTTTVDLSADGCFLYSADDWEVDSRIAIVFPEFEGFGPVEATVRWSVPWGTSTHWPGIGVHFENMPPELLERLAAYANEQSARGLQHG